MGATASRQLVIENLAFRPPHPSYDHSHPNLHILTTPRRNIAIMRFLLDSHNQNNGKDMDTRRVILYAHGNACDIGQCAFLLNELSQTLKTDIVAIDYPGYGLSRTLPEKQKPSARECSDSLYAVFEWLRREGYATQNIFLYGVSIGTGPRTRLAAHLGNIGVPLGGVLLQSPFTSIVGVGSHAAATTMHMCSDAFVSPDIFQSINYIGYVDAPLVIVHGDHDTLIPIDHASQLALANSHARLVVVKGAGHNNIESEQYMPILLSAWDLLLTK